jgi:hypothetical protein
MPPDCGRRQCDEARAGTRLNRRQDRLASRNPEPSTMIGADLDLPFTGSVDLDVATDKPAE